MFMRHDLGKLNYRCWVGRQATLQGLQGIQGGRQNMVAPLYSSEFYCFDFVAALSRILPHLRLMVLLSSVEREEMV